MEGRIINLSRFCTDDGPGIRTTVFLKGCPLRCLWCHNPESQSRESEILYSAEKCVGCTSCEAVCPGGCHSFREGVHLFQRGECIGCGGCAKLCPTEALTLSGKTVDSAEIFREVARDAVFYRESGGGVTVSGGEPLAQPAFTADLLRLCRENGIGTAVETCGFAGEAAVETVLPFCDFILFDVKETDPERHRRFTGVPLEPILKTLHRIAERKIPFRLRLPVIPGFNDREEHFAKAKELAAGFSSCQGLEVMPYHSLGQYKYVQLGKPYLCADVKEPTPETIARWRAAVEG